MPEITLPTELFDGEQYRWDIQQDGSIQEGSNDAYNSGLYLYDFPTVPNAQTEDGGRELVLGTATIRDLDVERKIYIPEDQAWARYLEVYTNPTDAAISYRVALETDLGSNGDTRIIETSSGDQDFNGNDTWVVTDDSNDGGEDPTMLHVVAGGNADIHPIDTYFSYDYLVVNYDLTLQPGETQIVMHFAAQNPDRQDAVDKANSLANLELGATAGLSAEERSQILNFNIPMEGSPEPDELIGDERRDIIFGLAGDDTIEGRGGDDSLDGGDGSDQIDGGAGRDTISGGSGSDALTGR